MRRTRRIAVVGFDAAQALDLTGSLDVFAAANALSSGRAPYELMIVGLKRGAFGTESGARMIVARPMDDALPIDTVVIPGGRGLRENANLRGALAKWLRTNARRIRRIAAVCTGIYPLAESGLLDGCRATTHWRYADDVRKRWPSICLDSDAIFIKAGNLYTSAGITAGIDLALALVEEDLGGATALAAARELVVYLKRAGGQMQYSAPLHFQGSATDEFSEIAAWMLEHIEADLTVEALAERMHCSPRHFSRRFKEVFGSTPARFVERLRLDAARWRLTEGDVAIEALGASVGYQSGDAFRRAFERHFGVPPTEYRERFGARPGLA